MDKQQEIQLQQLLKSFADGNLAEKDYHLLAKLLDQPGTEAVWESMFLAEIEAKEGMNAEGSNNGQKIWEQIQKLKDRQSQKIDTAQMTTRRDPKGILWHQGESDNSFDKAAKYMRRLQTLVSRLRSEFNNEKLRFVAGEIGYFKTKNFINPVLDSIAKVIPFSGIVSAAGLKDKGDKTHFNTASARELGRRYAAVMSILLKNKCCTQQIEP